MSGPHTEDPRGVFGYEQIERDQAVLYAERATRRARRTAAEAEPAEATEPEQERQ